MKWAVVILFLAQALGIAGCTEPARKPRAAYLLIDAARLRSVPAQDVVRYFLSALQPGESFRIACLGTGNFSDRDTIVSVSLDARPSLATQQKRLLKKKFDEFTPSPPPDAAIAREQLRRLLERAVAGLPETFRTVFVLREVEGLSVDDTSEILGIPAATVKTRLLRAKRRLQEARAPDVQEALTGTFPFAGADCAALTERVMRSLGYS